MDKISLNEIKKAVQEYEDEDTAKLSSENNNNATSNSNTPTRDASGNKSKKSLGKSKKDKNLSKSEKDKLNELAIQKIGETREFRQFEDEIKPPIHSWYEKACRFSGNIIKISPGKDLKPKIQDALNYANLNIDPDDTFSFAIIGPLIYLVIGLIITILFMDADLFFIAFFMLSGIGVMIPVTRLPFIFGDIARLKSAKEIVLCVFYIVTYMRQNSNLEKAIEFAGNHLTGPLGNDMKKILWDIETEKYDSISQSLNMYLQKWKKTNPEFIEVMNLIESSLYEPKDENRIALLDKALDVVLSETYEKMLHYTHEIQSPISTLHMLGIILPILGLVVLPLVVIFMEGVAWYHIAILYNVILPVSVYFVGRNILAKRPGGYGNIELREDNPLVIEQRKKARILGMKISPLFFALSIGLILVLIGISPLILHALLGNEVDLMLFQNSYDENSGIPVLEYRESQTETNDLGEPIYKGPFSMISALLGLFLILGIGLPIGLYYKYKTKGLIKIREDTLTLEKEFGSAIFQLGNRLGDGIPLEMAFTKVIAVMGETEPGKFFNIIDQNIRRTGMSVHDAIFDKSRGGIVYFPSNLIESTMKVLTESIKKGPLIAARAMINVARYVKEMHSVEERLKDLLADVISSMNSLIRFLAPVIAGIVVGITSMITTIIGTISGTIQRLGADAEQAGALQSLTTMFHDGIPTYYFQIVVGIYIIQIVYIISQAISGIKNGEDKLGEQDMISKYMLNSVVLYVIVTAVVTIIFNTIAIRVLGNIVYADFT